MARARILVCCFYGDWTHWWHFAYKMCIDFVASTRPNIAVSCDAVAKTQLSADVPFLHAVIGVRIGTASGLVRVNKLYWYG